MVHKKVRNIKNTANERSFIKKKKMFAWFLTLALFASLLCVPSLASAIDDSGGILQVKGTELLEELLSRQFESYKTGQIIDTSDIFLDSQSTQLYNQYLKWYTGLTDATKEYWTNYDFDMRFAGADNDELTFTADLSYTRTCSKYASEQYNFPYTIRIAAQNGKYYISEIDTEEANFHDFKGLLANADFVLKRTSAESVVDSLISDYVAFKEKCNNMVVDPADVVDMEETFNAYLAQDNSNISLKATSYSYDGERGRRYADTYYSTPNSCFYYEANADCTNFVSQCIWAAYGGWSDGDTNEIMSANIAARKRMQSSTSLDNWFGHKNGFGNPWGGVNNLWNFATGSPSTGPKATGVNNNKVWSNIACTSIVTGQVLQFRNGSSGDYGHSVYVSGGTNDTYANIKITQHTSNARRQLDEVIRAWGSDSCYMRQLKFSSANFDR